MLFKDKPIKSKLMTVIIMTCGIVLVLTCAAFFIYEYFSFRKSLLNETRTLGEMCATNITGSLAFENPRDAREVLSSLKVNPHIVAAVLYNSKDSVFAAYPDTLKLSGFKTPPFGEGFAFEEGYLEGYITVIYNGNKLGTLFLKSDMQAIRERFQLYGLIVLVVLIVALQIAWLVSRALQRNISFPILKLAHTAKAISMNNDYSIRAVKSGEDEVGLLTTSFNKMLSEIQKQDEEIKSFNQVLEQRVKERTAELELAYQEMEAFSYTVSHDLNAPLRQIDSFVSMYLEKQNLTIDEEGKKTLNRIVRNARKMRELIEDLLSFSQLGKQELNTTEVPMRQLVLSVFDDLRRLEDGRDISFTVEKIPNSFADQNTIQQVWTNLISNALKYSRNKNPAEINVGFEETEDAIVYCIKDNGVGFDMKDAEKLFTPFQRLHGSGDFEGTGVGLAIVNRIVSKHGGRVWADSKPNLGSTFFFSLPKDGISRRFEG